jgi:hypothetical protein
VVTIKFNHVNIDKPIGMLENLILDCKKVRDSINNKSHEEGDPSPSVADFYRKANETIGVVQGRIDTLKAITRRILELNQNGVGTSHVNGDIIIEGVPDSVENAGYAGFETWSRGVLDSKLLIKYSEEGCTPAQYDALLARMKQYQNDPSYAAAVFDEIGPGRLLDLPIDIGDNFIKTTGSGPARSTKNLRPNAEKDLANVLGHLLAARSQSWTDEEASKYANSLVQYAEEKNKGQRLGSLNEILSASRGVDIDGDRNNETVGLDYNDAFLLTLANRLENYKSKGGSDSRVTYGDRSNSLSGVVHAMTGNPDVATSWLTVKRADSTLDDRATAERTKKLIGRASLDENKYSNSTQWKDDWMMLSAQESIRGVKDPGGGMAQAAIASGALNTIGAGGDKIKLSTAARNSASITLSNYVYGAQQSAKPDGLSGWTIPVAGGDWAQGMPRQPVIDQKALTNILGQVGMDNHATTRFAGAQEAFNKQQVEGARGNDEVGITAVLQDQSNLRGFAAGAIARQSEIDGAASDERVGAWANAVSTAANAIPLPQTKGAGVALSVGNKFALNAGKSVASDGAESGVKSLFGGKEDKKKEENEKIKTAGSRANTEAEVLTLLNSGVYSQQELAEIKAHNKGVDISTVIDDEGNLLIDPNKVNPDNPTLSDDQKNALAHLGDTLPVGNHPGMAGFGQNTKQSYGQGYETAHGQKR